MKKLSLISVIPLFVIILTTPITLKCQLYSWDRPCMPSTAFPNSGSCTSSDIGRGITVDGKGNSYVVGTFAGNATFSPIVNFTSAGGSDIFIESFDRTPAFRWAIQGAGSFTDVATSIAAYPDGTGGTNLYVTGYFTSSITFTDATGTTTLNSTGGNATDVDMFILKLTDQGIITWAVDCGSTGTTTNPNTTIGWDIAVNNDGIGNIGIWVAGSFTGTNSFVTGTPMVAGSVSNQSGFLACYIDGITAPAGAAWAVAVNNASTCQAQGVDADNTGNSFITGYWLNGGVSDFGGTFSAVAALGTGSTGFVSAYNNTGAIQNAITFGNGGGTIGPAGKGIAASADGSVYVVGTFNGTSTFAGGPSLTALGGIDGFLLNMDNQLMAVNWVDRIGSSTGNDDARRVVVDACGERAYVVGGFIGTEIFGTSTVNTISVGGYDGYIADFDNTGTALRASRIGGGSTTPDDYSFDVAINSVEDVIFCGSYKTANLTGNPPLANNLGNGGLEDGFVARWDDSNWPVFEITSCAVNEGISVFGCRYFAAGEMSGSNVNFGGSTSTISSSFDGTFYDNDVYVVEYNKYANATNFVRLTSGLSGDNCRDIVTGAYHWVPGNAIPNATHQTVTFVGDATDSYTVTSNYASNAFLIKANQATGAVIWAASVTPNNAGATATAEGAAYDGNGNGYLCGYFGGQVNVWSGGNHTTPFGTYTATGATDIFVIKYNSFGTVQWVKTFGSTSTFARAFSISIDPSNANYYLTGAIGGNGQTLTLAHSHTVAGTGDGFVMRGSLVNGAAVNDAYFSTASVGARGIDIYSNGLDEVYVTGIKTSTGNVYIARYDLTGTSSPGAPVWSVNSSGGSAKSNDILLGTNGYVYVSGMIGSGSVTFGTLPALTTAGAYVVGLASWNGITTWESSVYTPATTCEGLAHQDGALAGDHGFINLIGGIIASPKQSYLHKASEEGLEFSSRYADQSFGNTLPTGGEITSGVYPNPFNNQATLKLDPAIDVTTAPVSFFIFDMSGRIVKSINGITSQETVFSADELVNGIYFYEVIQSGRNIITGKMVVTE